MIAKISVLILLSLSSAYSREYHDPAILNPHVDKDNCICFDRPGPYVKISDIINPEHHGLERLVIYLYQDIYAKEIKMYVPNVEKQKHIPDLVLESGDSLETAYFETIDTIMNTSPNKILIRNQTPKFIDLVNPVNITPYQKVVHQKELISEYTPNIWREFKKPEDINIADSYIPSHQINSRIKPINVPNQIKPGEKEEFNLWFPEQMERVNEYVSRGSERVDAGDVKKSLIKILYANGMYITDKGTLMDSKKTSLDLRNLILRPILVGNTMTIGNFLQNNGDGLPSLTESPYTQAILVANTHPFKVLGTFSIGNVYLPSSIRSSLTTNVKPKVKYSQNYIIRRFEKKKETNSKEEFDDKKKNEKRKPSEATVPNSSTNYININGNSNSIKRTSSENIFREYPSRVGDIQDKFSTIDSTATHTNIINLDESIEDNTAIIEPTATSPIITEPVDIPSDITENTNVPSDLPDTDIDNTETSRVLIPSLVHTPLILDLNENQQYARGEEQSGFSLPKIISDFLRNRRNSSLINNLIQGISGERRFSPRLFDIYKDLRKQKDNGNEYPYNNLQTNKLEASIQQQPRSMIYEGYVNPFHDRQLPLFKDISSVTKMMPISSIIGHSGPHNILENGRLDSSTIKDISYIDRDTISPFGLIYPGVDPEWDFASRDGTDPESIPPEIISIEDQIDDIEDDDDGDFRIIGGNAATGSGTPLSNKGRSGFIF